MFSSLFKRFSGRPHRKFVKRCQPLVQRINELETQYQSLSEDELKAKTDVFRQRIKDGETVDDLLPEAFAVVKNASRRLCGSILDVCGQDLPWEMVHFDVQLIGGIALHEGRIAEMMTGEGKTLVATLPLYLNALTGKNTQLVTVNDYLARRDSEWMGYVFKYLGLTVGCIQNSMGPPERKIAYGCDVTYGTASEFGFDYLRDNGMAIRQEDQVQRDHFFVIVDEIDSILVDEARTPLIISGPMAIQREQPFTRHMPGVDRLVRGQAKMCNELVTDARKELEKSDEERVAAEEELKRVEAENKERSAKGEDPLQYPNYVDPYANLYKVKQGMPKNKQLLRIMETPLYRKRLDKFDLEMNSDMNKEQAYRMKEELLFVIDEKQHQADLTERGRNTLRPDDPDGFMLPDLPTIFSELEKREDLTPEECEAAKQKEQEHFEQTSEDIHAISQLLRAFCLYERDVEYVLQENKVVIVDENTGRIMPGRRWSDGLHQAVEAKEGVTIERETRTYATVTIQNYFRMYEKLAGMTGTAETEATEFFDIYRLTVSVIPPNKPVARVDQNDVIYKTRRSKYNAAIRDVQEAHKRGQPVLVGTVSVEASEILGRMLRRVNIPHTVLNAKYHQQEAEIITRAGMPGGVTIATNMAGRGTDIKLGEGVKEAGGLFVVGTERHESRRIDRQLRGRCARQGDPGLTKFFISLEDDLMRLFASAGPLSRLMERSLKEDEELEHPLLNRSIESAQKKVEQQNYSIRKRLLQYDDVLNKQREIIYGIRNDALQSEEPAVVIFEMVEEEISARLEDAGLGGKGTASTVNLDGFAGWLNGHFPVAMKSEELAELEFDAAVDLILERIRKAYSLKQAVENAEALVGLERYLLLNAIDNHWQEHLTEMEDLRRSVGLRSYGQKDPLVEYKGEAFTYFEELMVNIRIKVCTSLFRSATNLVALENIKAMLARNARTEGPGTENDPAKESGGSRPPAGGREIKLPTIPVRRDLPKVGRNQPCPCGSGKKYKHCHGA